MKEKVTLCILPCCLLFSQVIDTILKGKLSSLHKTFYPWVKAEANYHKGNPGKLICSAPSLAF